MKTTITPTPWLSEAELTASDGTTETYRLARPVKTRVIIESPFSAFDPADIVENKNYLEQCIRACVLLGESPYASHKMLTDALDDADPAERDLGIKAGFLWREVAEKTVVFLDRGLSNGMVYGIQDALRAHRSIELRAFGTVDPSVLLRLEVLGLAVQGVDVPKEPK